MRYMTTPPKMITEATLMYDDDVCVVMNIVDAQICRRLFLNLVNVFIILFSLDTSGTSMS